MAKKITIPAQQVIRFTEATLDDIRCSDKVDLFYKFLEKLIDDGHWIEFHDLAKMKEKPPTIKTKDHLTNSRRQHSMDI